MPQIDQLTLNKAKNIFEYLYGRFEELGLTPHALKRFLKYGFIPDSITKTDKILTRELEMISGEFRRILVKVMKLRRTL